MINSSKRLTHHEETFSGAGERRLQVRGRHVLITAATDNVYVSFDDQSFLKRGKKSNINPGYEFTVVTIKSLVAQTVEFTVSDEKQDEGRDDVAVTTTASITPGNTFEGVADVALVAVTATQIIAADATRLGVIIKNPSSNTASVRIGASGSVGAAQGVELEPGESMPVATTAAVYGYSVPGESVSVSVVREV